MGRPDEDGWWSMVVTTESGGDARVEVREHNYLLMQQVTMANENPTSS
jgi:hypothetical protein